MSIYRARLRSTSNALSPPVSSEQIRLQVTPKLFGVDSWIPQTIGQWIPDCWSGYRKSILCLLLHFKRRLFTSWQGWASLNVTSRGTWTVHSCLVCMVGLSYVTLVSLTLSHRSVHMQLNAELNAVMRVDELKTELKSMMISRTIPSSSSSSTAHGHCIAADNYCITHCKEQTSWFVTSVSGTTWQLVACCTLFNVISASL